MCVLMDEWRCDVVMRWCWWGYCLCGASAIHPPPPSPLTGFVAIVCLRSRRPYYLSIVCIVRWHHAEFTSHLLQIRKTDAILFLSMLWFLKYYFTVFSWGSYIVGQEKCTFQGYFQIKLAVDCYYDVFCVHIAAYIPPTQYLFADPAFMLVFAQLHFPAVCSLWYSLSLYLSLLVTLSVTLCPSLCHSLCHSFISLCNSLWHSL